MTNFLFWEDPYLTVLNTTVLSVDGNAVILKDTIGYAEAGGQESDQIKINTIPVLVYNLVLLSIWKLTGREDIA